MEYPKEEVPVLFTQAQADNVRRRVLCGLAAQGKSVRGLAVHLGLSASDITQLFLGKLSWLTPLQRPRKPSILAATARYLRVAPDVLLPWTDPMPLLLPLMPVMPFAEKMAWERPQKVQRISPPRRDRP